MTLVRATIFFGNKTAADHVCQLANVSMFEGSLRNLQLRYTARDATSLSKSASIEVPEQERISVALLVEGEKIRICQAVRLSS